MPMYRKKPVVIEAHQVPYESDYDNRSDYLNDSRKLADWCSGDSLMGLLPNEYDGPHIDIETLEGIMKAIPSDFIIKGVKGEFYPCKEDIFYATYEKV